MARCSCGGSTCSCRVVAGAGVEVSGNGSSATPYVIDATGDISGALIAISSDTLQLATTGEGTEANPMQITGHVTMELTDLLDVADPATPQEGEVPVWTTDHWEFKIPTAAPPGTVNVGAGILGDGSSGSPLMSAISGVWGSGSMAGFPADTTLGTPVYIDAFGQMRARPAPIVKHAESPFAYNAGWTNLGGTWQQMGNLISIQGYVRRTGASISGGNIADIGVGTLISAIPRPISGNLALAPWGGFLHASALTTAGAFVLGGLPAGTFVGGVNGAYLSYSLTYIAKVTGAVILG